MLRQSSLRLLGLVVALCALALGAQYLTAAVADAPLLDARRVDAVADWMQRSHGDGAEVLVGLGAVLLAVWFAYAFVTTFSTRRDLLATRNDRRSAGSAGGSTSVDRRRLARAIERHVRSRVPGPTASVHVTRHGRVDADVASNGEPSTEAVQQVGAAIERIIDDRGLPCRTGRVHARAAREKSGRVQ